MTDILIDTSAGVMTITLNRVAKKNSFTSAMYASMAEALEHLAPKRKTLDDELYGRAYREVGLPRLRAHQVDLIVVAGYGLGHALRTRGVATLLGVLRGPARGSGSMPIRAMTSRRCGICCRC